LAITETWLHADTRDLESAYQIPGYKMFHKDRHVKKGGGVILYIKEHLLPIKIEHQTVFEIINVTIKIKFQIHSIILVYRPPNSPGTSDIKLYNTLSNILNAQTSSSILMGDFNCRNIDWENRTGNPEGRKLLDF
jgi:exonuclease III